MTSVTINTTQSYLMNAIVQVDSAGTPLAVPDTSYGPPTFTNSNPAVITMAGPRATCAGGFGSATIVATETSAGKPDISGTVVVTVEVPVPAAALQIGGVIQQGN